MHYMRLGWIYFVEAIGIGRIKVGYTGRRPAIRLSRLKTASPVELRPLGLMRGSRSIEGMIHDHLASCHWRDEWFHAAPLLLDFISEKASPWSSADDIMDRLPLVATDWVEHEVRIGDEIVAWFEARGIEPVFNATRRNIRIRNQSPAPDGAAP